jgi:hypothetical protein
VDLLQYSKNPGEAPPKKFHFFTKNPCIAQKIMVKCICRGKRPVSGAKTTPERSKTWFSAPTGAGNPKLNGKGKENDSQNDKNTDRRGMRNPG